MDPSEEQKQELEVLESIYPDELHLISDTEFTINLVLDVESKRKHAVKIHVKYPDKYPEVLPDLWIEPGDVEGNEGVAEELEVDQQVQETLESVDMQDSQKALNLLETIVLTKNDLDVLANKIHEEAKLNIGMPSIFTLASVLKDDAEQLFNEKLDAEAKKIEQARAAREKKEQKKFVGTKVTKENFSAWRDKFRKEMGYDERMKQRFEEIHHGKLTGKQIFDQGLAGEETEDPVASVTEGVKATGI